MLADIARQRDVLAALLSRADAFVAAGRELLSPGRGGRVFACGCGDGFFAADAAGLFAWEAGLDWRAVGALDLALSATRLRGEDRVIAISMSGNVDRTVEAANAVVTCGVPLLALINGEGGRLGRLAGAKVSLDIPDMAPFLCGTSSYTATVLALMLAAAGAAGEDSAAAGMQAVPAAVATASETARRVLTDLDVRGITGVRMLAGGANIGTARYGAAKFVELTRIPAWSADLEEFAHSQYWAMPTSDLVVVIATDPGFAAYADESCRALGHLGVRTLAIDTPSTPVSSAALRITLPDIARPLAPLVAAVPLQHLAHDLARATGLDPDTRLHLKSDEIRFGVSRMLTRRSLLGTGK